MDMEINILQAERKEYTVADAPAGLYIMVKNAYGNSPACRVIIDKNASDSKDCIYYSSYRTRPVIRAIDSFGKQVRFAKLEAPAEIKFIL